MPNGQGKPVVSLSLWEDLKRRNVYRVGVGYAAFAWLAIEVSETVFPILGLPETSVTMVLVLALIGLPIALVLGWIFQITPEGLVFDKPQNVRWSTYIVVDALIVAAFVAAGTIYWNRIHDVVAPDTANSIAVLPFENIGNDPEAEAFARGLPEELLTRLWRLGELKVSSRSATEHLRGRTLPMKEIGDVLSVQYVVEGSVLKERDRLRVTVQLIDAAANDHVWSDTYEKPVRGLQALTAEIATDIVGGLNLALSIPSVEIINVIPTENGEAYVAYLRAREYLRRDRTPDHLSRAEILFSNAVDLDPRFAAAHAGLCRTFLGSFVIERDTTWFEKAEKSCHRALTLNDSQPDVYVALGELYALSSQHDKAIENYDAALLLKVGDAEALMNKGMSLDKLGKTADAEAALRSAAEREPYFWRARNSLARFLMRHSRYAEAVVEFKAVAKANPTSYHSMNNLAAAQYMAGNIEASIEAFNRSIEIEPNRSALANVANLNYYRGDFAEAANRYEQSAALMPMDDRPVGGLAASARFVPERKHEVQELFGKAAELAEQRLAVAPADTQAWARLANYRAYRAERAQALEALDSSGLNETDDPEVIFFGCLTYLALNEHEKAILLLETLVAEGYPREIIVNDPDLAAIRDDHRISTVLLAGQKH